MLRNVAAHNESLQNVKVSKCERHIMYSVTERTASKNVKCTLRNVNFTFCNGICFVALYDFYVLKTLHFWNSYVVCSYVL
jgi:hypothetical protein